MNTKNNETWDSTKRFTISKMNYKINVHKKYMHLVEEASKLDNVEVVELDEKYNKVPDDAKERVAR